ncbi:hypothetical protein HPP92_009641 [Vanilla planifolia]|uniref:Uncharacterized protein n=1 Tax=Vanilla planifolia TaxID=51239 RepID=A0A835RGK4_VANPL|nr:hypothetical protein HPP92_009641 [Vanilla planifolia]
MDLDFSSKSSKSLHGIHGVKLVQKSPWRGQCEDLSISTCANTEKGQTSPILILPQIWQQRPSFLRPIHCSIQGDQNIVETVANVLTSVPFVILGLQAPRKNLNSVLYANSLIGVGIASSLYHCSRGQVRRLLRWADYTMIATATICLSRALHSENPKLLMAASAMFLPFQPLMVSAVHTGMMEVAFAKKALTKPELRTAHNLHAMSSVLGGLLFVADDLFPETPCLHAAWHLAAAVGVGTCNKLLE